MRNLVDYLYYHEGGPPTIDIYLGDCLEVMPLMSYQIPFSLVLTDPPYEKEAHTLQCRVKREGGVMKLEPLEFAPITEEQRSLASKEMARLCCKWFLVFCQVEASQEWRKRLEESGLSYKRTCIWVKPDGMPQYSGDRPGMGYESIVAMHHEGRSNWNGGGATWGIYV